MVSIRAIAALGMVVALCACSQAPRVANLPQGSTKVSPQVRAGTFQHQSSTSSVASANAQNISTSGLSNSGEYRIGVDDQIKISVWRNPELSVEVPVRPDGFISAPLIGDVEAGGFTASEVATKIEAKLEQYIRQPKVSVILTSLVSHQFLNRVRVTGAIDKPVSLPYRQGMTVLDIVLEAGGLSDFAVGSRARLYRKNKFTGETDVIKIRLDKIIYKGDLSTNVELVAGDVLTVPERRF